MTPISIASAQDATTDQISNPVEASTETEPAEGEIVVTGSRLGSGLSSGFTSPTPVTVLDSQRVEALAITNVGDALNQLPSFRATSGPATQANQGGNIGARVLDLRGLGSPRTLVLVDGHRFVPSTSQGTVDVNLIPSALVSRTEVVTGGASAAYGSDAVAGVVNFILNRRFEGIRAEAIGGISQLGDDESQYLSLTAGSRIGDRLHVAISGEYENNEGLGTCYSRSWCATETLIFGNTPAGTGGLPGNLIIGNVHTSTVAPGGLINRSYDAAGSPIGTMAGDPLRGTTFTPDGTPRAFEYGSSVGSLFMVGGEGYGRNSFFYPLLLKVPVERYSLYGIATLDVTDTIRASLDVSYGKVSGTVVSNVLRDPSGSLMGRIQRDNPFIPRAIAEQMDANGVAAIQLGKADFSLGPAYATSDTETWRTVAGLEGEFGAGWTWDVGYQYGRTHFRQNTYNAINLVNLQRAVDAVEGPQGAIVCRVNADADPANDDPACAPYNPFGEGLFSQAADGYITGNGFQDTINDQHMVAANLRGSLFDLPAGSVALAIGADYRRDEIEGTTDPVSMQNGFWTLNGSALSGAVEVKEAYAELAVPVFEDSALGYALDLNGALRRTDYSTTGAVTTWKAGVVYQPVDGIRLRATRSRDIRAPNLVELVGPRTKRSIGFTDPDTGQQSSPTVITGSNPDLRVERADSWTIGGVISPTGSGPLSRLRLSVDYYDISVKDAIGILGAQTLANRCSEGVSEFCALITRDPQTNAIVQIDDLFLNSNELRARGFDIEFRYRQPLGTAGDLDLSVLANIASELTTVDVAGAIDRAGQTGWRTGTVPGVPDYAIDGMATWTLDQFQLTAHGRYIPSGIFWTNFVGPDQEGYSITLPNSVDNNRVQSRFYLDLAFQWRVEAGDREFEFFTAVNNVFDRDPPIAPGSMGTTNQLLFEPVGRAFRAGVRVRLGA
ncbi:hypothetical protein ASD76_04065 [Altererythrobacter sp. Root672]|nr:hypothetical protein ASD76_04065 [Altererythrobacter sp. Root672]